MKKNKMLLLENVEHRIESKIYNEQYNKKLFTTSFFDMRNRTGFSRKQHVICY